MNILFNIYLTLSFIILLYCLKQIFTIPRHLQRNNAVFKLRLVWLEEVGEQLHNEEPNRTIIKRTFRFINYVSYEDMLRLKIPLSAWSYAYEKYIHNDDLSLAQELRHRAHRYNVVDLLIY